MDDERDVELVDHPVPHPNGLEVDPGPLQEERGGLRVDALQQLVVLPLIEPDVPSVPGPDRVERSTVIVTQREAR